jgi:hypothetical protein
MFEKVRAKFDSMDDVYHDQPTQTRIRLKNGSTIYCLPVGKTGHYIRGFTLDLLIADEAAFIPESVWLAVEPMIAVSRTLRKKGWIFLLSTPLGKGGYYYDTFTDPDFKSWHISSESCPRISKAFLAKKKRSMTKLEYAQEYLAEFVDDYKQFFPTKLIRQQMNFIDWSKKNDSVAGANYYLGLDLARYGGDETAYVIVEEYRNRLKAVKTIKRERVSTTHTVGETRLLDDNWRFRRILIDSGGLGGPVLDQLQEALGKRRVIGLDNSSKGVFVEGEEKRNKILKEDLYSFTLMLLETGKLSLINDLDLMRSLKSITFEYTAEKKLKLFGKYSHLTEALIRACWGALKEKGLKVYVY